ncbi:hypothetical protein RFI_01438 [Reticulomyxa filosa]|uniref:Uncharacterized protein n=1 Tax=Reticulomyxa filosa TaxID=46433 RepID=X6PC29_RETFI|nr:hypothetical protein RFI_01438 [Reticulomyxa filosa]|eukprot:ETO35619.1 hypothetical protein RFI_01438 [Reticulomyxa filosa]
MSDENKGEGESKKEKTEEKQKEQAKAQEQEKADEEARKKRLVKGDYIIHVHIIEGRELKGRHVQKKHNFLSNLS